MQITFEKNLIQIKTATFSIIVIRQDDNYRLRKVNCSNGTEYFFDDQTLISYLGHKKKAATVHSLYDPFLAPDMRYNFSEKMLSIVNKDSLGVFSILEPDITYEYAIKSTKLILISHVLYLIDHHKKNESFCPHYTQIVTKILLDMKE
jgi:hypothetical protein